MCVDKTKVIFLSEALEIVDISSDDFHHHEIFDEYCYTNRKEGQQIFYKAVGNVVITQENVISIKLDPKAQAVFDKKVETALKRHQEDEAIRNKNALKRQEEEEKK